MKEHKGLKVSFLCLNAPAVWPSVALIADAFFKHAHKILPNARVYQILSDRPAPTKDDFWIAPLGSVHPYLFQWLKKEFPSPYKRPRMIFFLNGQGAKGAFDLYYHRELFRVDDEWIVASDVEKNLLDDFFPGNARTHVVYHPVDARFKVGTKEKRLLRKKLSLPPNKKIMLYAGRVSQQKNILNVLEMLEKFKDLHFVVVGDCDSLGFPHLKDALGTHMATEFISEIAKRKLNDRVEFRGFLAQSQLSDFMQACDYQISLSSHYGEDYGYSIVQGMACGLKTILSYWGGHTNWEPFFKPSELVYVPIEWDKGVGSPDLSKIALPTKRKSDFKETLNAEFKRRFISVLANKDFSGRKVTLNVSPDIKKYWDEIEGEVRKRMFNSHENTIFRKVVSYYSKSN